MRIIFEILTITLFLVALTHTLIKINLQLAFLECRTAVYFPDKSPEEAIKICEGLLK